MRAPKAIKIPGLETYYGGKGGEGVYQTVINHFPPHNRYVEGCLGGGWIMRYKKPAKVENIGIDKDPAVIQLWQNSRPGENYFFHHMDVKEWIRFNKDVLGRETLIYLDAPYQGDTRKDQRPNYLYEMLTRDEHKSLLLLALELRCNVAISCYDNDLYSEMLKGWKKIHFTGQTRRGPRTETLYMNYDLEKIGELHDYRFLGGDYRERERIRRKIGRWVEGLEKLPVFERKAIWNTLQTARLDADR